jgi:RNA polymerase sigma factor (sigma-70 family)
LPYLGLKISSYNKLSVEEENKLIAGCLNGDKESVDTFAQQYTRLIFRHLIDRFKCCTKDNLKNKDSNKTPYDKLGSTEEERKESIEEIAHDFFVEKIAKDNFALLKKFQRLNGASLATWIRISTIHFAVDYIRKDIRMKGEIKFESMNDPVKNNDDSSKIGEFQDTIASSARAPGDIAITNEEIKRISDVIETLGGIKREIIKLLFIEGRSPREVSEELSVSIDTVYSRKSEAVKELKEKIKK